MEIIHTNIPGVLIIEPRVFKDSRGYFFESFSQREFDKEVTPIISHSILRKRHRINVKIFILDLGI